GRPTAEQLLAWEELRRRHSGPGYRVASYNTLLRSWAMYNPPGTPVLADGLGHLFRDFDASAEETETLKDRVACLEGGVPRMEPQLADVKGRVREGTAGLDESDLKRLEAAVAEMRADLGACRAKLREVLAKGPAVRCGRDEAARHARSLVKRSDVGAAVTLD